MVDFKLQKVHNCIREEWIYGEREAQRLKREEEAKETKGLGLTNYIWE